MTPLDVWDKLERGAYTIERGFESSSTTALNEILRLEAEFKRDLLAYYEVTDSPKADKAFAIAWDIGHASGYSDIAHTFADLVELIK
jgi:hypothetical protein